MVRLLHGSLEGHSKGKDISVETVETPFVLSLDDFLRSPLHGVGRLEMGFW